MVEQIKVTIENIVINVKVHYHQAEIIAIFLGNPLAVNLKNYFYELEQVKHETLVTIAIINISAFVLDFDYENLRKVV